MASESFFLRFFWGPRPEEADRCAGRLAAFVSELAKIDSAFGSLRSIDGSGDERPAPPDRKRLADLLWKHGVNRRDADRSVIPELGFSLTLVANGGDVAFPVEVGCGRSTEWVPNRCLIEFPNQGKTSSRLVRAPVLVRIAKAVVAAWEPDHGVVTSLECSRLVQQGGSRLEAGWITFLSGRFSALTTIPSFARVESIVGGRLIVATPDRPSCEDPDYAKFIRSLTASLRSGSCKLGPPGPNAR